MHTPPSQNQSRLWSDMIEEEEEEENGQQRQDMHEERTLSEQGRPGGSDEQVIYKEELYEDPIYLLRRSFFAYVHAQGVELAKEMAVGLLVKEAKRNYHLANGQSLIDGKAKKSLSSLPLFVRQHIVGTIVISKEHVTNPSRLIMSIVPYVKNKCYCSEHCDSACPDGCRDHGHYPIACIWEIALGWCEGFCCFHHSFRMEEWRQIVKYRVQVHLDIRTIMLLGRSDIETRSEQLKWILHRRKDITNLSAYLSSNLHQSRTGGALSPKRNGGRAPTKNS
jgi:hypothetical protein